MPPKTRLLRTFSQLLVLGLVFTAPLVQFHMLCPFGGLETLSRFVQQGLFVPKTSLTAVMLFFFVIAVTAVAGAVFCSWVCPLGSLQDWIYRFSPFSKKLRISLLINWVMGWGRYLVLGLILWGTWSTYNLVFLSWDPYYALVHLFSDELPGMAAVVLLVVVTASFFVSRPWCRWFCPLGAVLGLVQKFAPFTVRIRREACSGCRLCGRTCPMGVDPQAKDRLTDPACIRCGDCREVCPRPGALSFPALAPIVAAAVLLTGFFVVPRLVEAFAGEAPRTEITGGMTLEELANQRSLPAAALLQKLDLPPDYPLGRKVRDLEDDHEEKTLAWVKEVMDP